MTDEEKTNWGDIKGGHPLNDCRNHWQLVCKSSCTGNGEKNFYQYANIGTTTDAQPSLTRPKAVRTVTYCSTIRGQNLAADSSSVTFAFSSDKRASVNSFLVVTGFFKTFWSLGNSSCTSLSSTGWGSDSCMEVKAHSLCQRLIPGTRCMA